MNELACLSLLYSRVETLLRRREKEEM